jgi:hypothetical protein
VFKTKTFSKPCFLNWINEAALFSRLNNRQSHWKKVHTRSELTLSPDAQATSVLATILRTARGRSRRMIRIYYTAAERQDFTSEFDLSITLLLRQFPWNQKFASRQRAFLKKSSAEDEHLTHNTANVVQWCSCLSTIPSLSRKPRSAQTGRKLRPTKLRSQRRWRTTRLNSYKVDANFFQSRKNIHCFFFLVVPQGRGSYFPATRMTRQCFWLEN